MNPSDQLRENLQSLMGRFGKARWIDSSIVTPNKNKIDFTPLGNQRMDAIFNLCEIAESNLQPAGSSVGAALREIIDELLPPNLSKGEMETLVHLAQLHHQKMQ